MATNRRLIVWGFAALLVLSMAAQVGAWWALGGAGAQALAGLPEAFASGGIVGLLVALIAPALLPWVGVMLAGPVLGLIGLLLAGGRGAAPAADLESQVAAPGRDALPAGPDPDGVALRLLAVLQEEARLIDFVREDIESYNDAEVGAAARGIHGSLRRALEDRMTLRAIHPGEDGSTVEVPAGFDPAQIRIVGSPTGKPPWKGTLLHGGWYAEAPRLPRPTEGSDAGILAPAEIEVGEA
ncbi:MAG: DUF2760 domain-containing protein [Deltaproteobacteria bacterium]